MVIETSSLFNLKRFHETSVIYTILFILYVPLGLLLLVVRIFLSFQYLLILAILPKDWLIRRILARIYFFSIGILVTCGGKHHRKKESKILLSNHVSLLDGLSIEAVHPTRRRKEHTSVPGWLSWLLNFELTQKEEVNGSVFPLAYYPELTLSNGKVGLLKFSTDKFKDMKGIIQPMVILSNRPAFIPANISHIRSTFMADLLWTLLTPYTRFHLCYMPVREIPEDKEQLEDFISSLQKDMAYVLNIEATNVTAQDGKELLKRIITEERRAEERRLAAAAINLRQQPQMTLSPSLSLSQRKLTETLRMVEQIKSVLPQVPFKLIQQDLEVTKNIDISITRLIDGTVSYNPLNEEEQEKERKMIEEKKRAINAKISAANNSATLLSKNWKDRHYSFQEKKRIMIEHARIKYLELHPEYA